MSKLKSHVDLFPFTVSVLFMYHTFCIESGIYVECTPRILLVTILPVMIPFDLFFQFGVSVHKHSNQINHQCHHASTCYLRLYPILSMTGYISSRIRLWNRIPTHVRVVKYCPQRQNRKCHFPVRLFTWHRKCVFGRQYKVVRIKTCIKNDLFTNGIIMKM